MVRLAHLALGTMLLAVAPAPAWAQITDREFAAACSRSMNLSAAGCACFAEGLTGGATQLNNKQQIYAIAIITNDDARIESARGNLSDAQIAAANETLKSLSSACAAK